MFTRHPVDVSGPYSVWTIEATGQCGAGNRHRHYYDHWTRCVFGRVRVWLDDVSIELGPGQEVLVRAEVLHGVDALEDAVYECRYQHRSGSGEVVETYVGHAREYDAIKERV